MTMYRTYPPELLNEIRDLLIRDRELNFQREGNYLRHGVCPQCGKPEVFINLDEPYRMECGRKNKCGWNQTARMRYPELFDNLSRRYSPTESNPNATADAYLKYSRGFDLEKIRGMYKQGYVHPAGSPERTYLPCIEVEIAGIPPEVSKPAKKTVWKRLIDEDDVKYAEKFATAKAKTHGGYKGYAWIPPQMRFNDKDEIWITEGIFKSMALMHVGKKSIAALSCSNFPREVVRKNAGRQIRWIVALDNDAAGIDAAERFLAELRGMNEECYCAIPPHEHEDWDDLYRKERLTENFLQRCIGEGSALQAPTQMRKAFMTYALLKWKYFVFEFGNVLYRCTVRDPDTTKEGEYQVDYPRSGNFAVPRSVLLLEEQHFSNLAEMERICDCNPEAVFTEYDPVTRRRTSSFTVNFPDRRRSPRIMEIDGQFLQSATTFSAELLKTTVYIAFAGNNKDMEYLRKRWNITGQKEVNVVDYIGYDHESHIYAFDKFAYRHGKLALPNAFGYYDFGEECLKTRKTDFPIQAYKDVKPFDPGIFPDFYKVFSDNGVILLAWWTGTFFAEQIRKNYASWCFMEYTGERGAGKSTLLRFMWKMTGAIREYEGRNPRKGTETALYRELASFSNLPFIILEADDLLNDKNNKTGFNFASLKEFYNFGAVTRAVGVKTAGVETRQELFRSGLLISQNRQISGDPEGALISRIVSCHCTREHFSPESRAIAERFERMSSNDLGGYLHLCLSRERELLDEYPVQFAKAYSALTARAEKNKSIRDDRVLKCHAQVAAWVALLRKLFPNFDQATFDRVIERLWSNAEKQQRRLNNEDPIMEEFWNTYDYLNMQKVDSGYVETLNHSRNPNYIAIHLQDYVQKLAANRQVVPDLELLKEKIPGSFRHKFVEYKKVNSAILNKTLKCYIFQKQENEE